MKRYFFCARSFIINAIVLSCLSCFPCKAATATQNRDFISVEGMNLQARLDKAVKLSVSRAQTTPFRVAYTFEVRPGIVVDPGPLEFEATVEESAGGTIKIGLCSDAAKETRNLAIFLQYKPDGKSIERLDVYNLDHPRQMGGHLLYWLGRAASQESLEFLTGIAETSQSRRVTEHSIAAISMHNEKMASSTLRGFILDSSNKAARLVAVFWLGQFEADQDFLAGLVGQERVETEIRQKAAFAIGTSNKGEPIEVLKNLFGSVDNRRIKRHILLAISIAQDTDKALSFLVLTAENSPDPGIRRYSLTLIGMRAGRHFDAAEKKPLGSSHLNGNLHGRYIFDVSRKPKSEAVPALIKIAKTHPDASARSQALFWLSYVDEKQALELYKEILLK